MGTKKRVIGIKESLNCSSSWVILVISCLTCNLQYVSPCLVPVEVKVHLLTQAGSCLLGVKHTGHKIGLSIVDRVNAGNTKALDQKRITWMSKLIATSIEL